MMTEAKNNIQVEMRLEGLALSEGCAVARVCMFNEERHSNLPVYRIKKEALSSEVGRMERAFQIVDERLGRIREKVGLEVGAAEAEIFVAQQMILKDDSFVSSTLELIEGEKLNAETAVALVLDKYETRLSALDNEYIRERASDIGEIRRRVLDVLANINPSLECAGEEHCQKGKNRIIVAEELTPTLTVDLDSKHTMGFVTERGGVNSHAAILARALGIPAVSNIPGIRQMITCGTELLVDGTKGSIVIWPREQTIADARALQPDAVRMPVSSEPVEGLRVLANITGAYDVDEAIEMKAEGVGLYRTELEVLAAGRLLDEDELYNCYSAVVKGMKGLPVVFRLLDIGSDKSLPFLGLPREENPSLGWRGARLLLAKKELVVMQARAMARASRHGPVSVLYPMIVDVDQFIELRRMFLDATRDLEDVRVKHGVMFEVPSACLQASRILEVAEFASIGSNDLIQYLFAVDRDNENVAYDYNPDKQIFWDLLGTLVCAARAAGKPISLCGEMGGEPRYVAKLLELGLDTVSVSARRIAAVRRAAAIELTSTVRASDARK